MCECEAELSQEVADQGCCLDTFHEFITTAVNLPYDPRELYKECGVEIPGGCSNSPVSISSSVAMVSTLTTTTALIVSVVLALDYSVHDRPPDFMQTGPYGLQLTVTEFFSCNIVNMKK